MVSAVSRAISRAEERLGFPPHEEVLKYARKLTEQKIQAKGLPEDYFPLLYVIVETYSMAFINAIGEQNRRCQECVRSATTPRV